MVTEIKKLYLAFLYKSAFKKKKCYKNKLYHFFLKKHQFLKTSILNTVFKAPVQDVLSSGAGTGGGSRLPALFPGGAKGAVLPDKTDDKQKSTGATKDILVIKV